MTEDRECHERVVLVSVKGGSKPRRKVAIALPPENDYAVFAERVRTKLNLSAIAGIYHAETNSAVVDLRELQDIDDLVVVEGAPPPSTSTPEPARSMSALTAASPTPPPESPQMLPSANTSTTSIAFGASSRKPRSGSGAESQAVDIEGGVEDDGYMTEGDKYVRRTGPVTRAMQQMGMVSAPGLPVTSKEAGGSRKRRAKGGAVDPRKMLLLFALCSCLATMLLLYTRISSGPDVAAEIMDEARQQVKESETLMLDHR